MQEEIQYKRDTYICADIRGGAAESLWSVVSSGHVRKRAGSDSTAMKGVAAEDDRDKEGERKYVLFCEDSSRRKQNQGLGGIIRYIHRYTGPPDALKSELAPADLLSLYPYFRTGSWTYEKW